MFLYEKREKEIDVYSFLADKKALIEYKKKILENQDIYKLFYSLETTNENIKNRFIEADELNIRFLNHEYKTQNMSDWWSELKCEKSFSKSKQNTYEKLLERYINGEFFNIIPTRTFKVEDGVDSYINNFLCTSKPKRIYSNIEKRSYYRFENIIDLPKELCALQLLENGEFSKLLSTKLSYEDLLKLFSIKQVGSVNIQKLQKMFAFELLPGTYEDTMMKVDITGHVLKKVKK